MLANNNARFVTSLAVNAHIGRLFIKKMILARTEAKPFLRLPI